MGFCIDFRQEYFGVLLLVAFCFGPKTFLKTFLFVVGVVVVVVVVVSLILSSFCMSVTRVNT